MQLFFKKLLKKLQNAIDKLKNQRYNIVAKCNRKKVNRLVNTLKLKGRIVEMNTTISEIAKEMKLTPYTLGQKISGKTLMSLNEADELQRILKISDVDFRSYFFAL